MKSSSFISFLALTTIASCTQPYPFAQATTTAPPRPTSPSPTLPLAPQVIATSSPIPSPTYIPCPFPSLFPSSTPGLPPSTPLPFAPTLPPPTSLHLIEWTPTAANTLIQTLAIYPEGLTYQQRGYHDSGYYHAFTYASLAEQEALLRFPDSPWVDAWAWDHAYRMALEGAPAVTQAYADIVDHALNLLHVPVSRLAYWMNRCDPRIAVSLSPVPPGSPAPEGHLVEISGQSRAAGSYIWIAPAGPSFEVFPLDSAWDFGYSSAAGIDFDTADMTGDGFPEVVISHYHFPGSMDAWVTEFDVFDVIATPPRRLTFDPPLPRGYDRTWSALSPAAEGPGLRFDFSFDTSVCPFTWARLYRWETDRFLLVDETVPEVEAIIRQVGRAREDGLECIDYLLMVLLHRLREGDLYLVNNLQRLVSAWPYSQSVVPPNEENAPDERDRARFLIGLYLALHGDVEAARLQMTTIVAAPVADSSRWIAPARAMLGSLHTAQDLLHACAVAQVCFPYLQIGELSRYSHLPRDTDLVTTLRSAGYPIVDSLRLDANADARTDLFLIQRSPDPEVSEPSWLLIASEHAYEAFQISYPPGSAGIVASSAFSSSPVFAVATPEGRVLYAILEDPARGHLEVERLCAVVQRQLEQLQTDLLHSADPTRVQSSILALDAWVHPACAAEPWSLDWILPRHLYFLGLASELAGDRHGAVDAYMGLWTRYPDSAYAILASAKLRPAP